MLPDETIQDFIFRYTMEFNNKTKINNRVNRKANDLQDDNYTVLTGTLKIATVADQVFLIPPTNSSVQSRFGGFEEANNWHRNEIAYLKRNNIKPHLQFLKLI